MSNALALLSSGVPAFARTAEPSGLLSALAQGGDFGKRLSIKGGVFRLVDGGKEVAAIEERYLDVVIVRAAPTIGRVFYAKGYDPEASPTAPDCQSADGLTPMKGVADKQSDNCASCPKNVAGSGKGDSRACRYQQRIALVLANDMEGDVLQLALPATSLFGKDENGNMPLQAYARALSAQRINPNAVVTRLKFDTKAENPKLFFKPMRWLDEDEYRTVVEQGESADAESAVTMTVSQVDGVPSVAAPKTEVAPASKKVLPPEDDDEPPAPAAKRRGRPTKEEAATKAAARPPTEDADDEPPAPPAKKKAAAEPAEEPDEPPVRKAAGKPTTPEKKSLAALAEEWGDD